MNISATDCQPTTHSPPQRAPIMQDTPQEKKSLNLVEEFKIGVGVRDKVQKVLNDLYFAMSPEERLEVWPDDADTPVIGDDDGN